MNASRTTPNRLATLGVALVALAVLGATTAADASAAKWVVKGRGWGHGVGMSQYGAYGMALDGARYRAILRHYYKRTKLRPTKPRRVRVLLSAGAGSVTFTGATRACGRELSDEGRYAFTLGRKGVALRNRSGRRIASCGRAGGATGGRAITYLGKGSYRGTLIARRSGGSLSAINAVGIEGYLRGVVPNEVPASWPVHTLRAQAVAARSYALATRVNGDGFDLYDDTRSQVYSGRSSEARSTNRAVRATKREVVMHRGEIAVTYFSSTSGGKTESVEFGFPGARPRPYLKAVKDPYDKISPYHRWRVTFAQREIEDRLGDLVRGRLRRIRVVERGDSPRIVTAKVIGSKGSTKTSGTTLQARLGLRSTWARFRPRR